MFIIGNKMELDLSTQQRLILLNQYKILEKLYPEEAEKYSQYQDIVVNGFTLHYADLINLEYISEPMKKEDMEFVLDILDVYDALYDAVKIRQNQPEYKGKKIVFPGFDGNNEYRLIEYMQFFIYKLNRFDCLRKKNSNDYNTHGITKQYYEQMIEKWRKFKINESYLNDKNLEELIDMSYPGSLIKDEE